MIELEHVTKHYGRGRARTVALRDVSLHVPAGSVWAVVGPNGAGKSTFLALTLGFIRPSRGDVLVGGLPPREYLRDHGAGYLAERFRLPSEWRTGDALHMLGRLGGGDDAAARRVTAEFGLEPYLGRRLGELSRGVLQRLGLAQALLVPRAVVVLDEPTEGLDPIWRIRLRDVITDLRAAGCTVVIASHDLVEIERVADRAVVLERGSIREILDLRTDPTQYTYRVALASPFDRVTDAFPNAEAVDDTAFTVVVTGAAELSERIGALLALGAVLTAVEPLRQPLEQRVRDALEDDG